MMQTEKRRPSTGPTSITISGRHGALHLAAPRPTTICGSPAATSEQPDTHARQSSHQGSTEPADVSALRAQSSLHAQMRAAIAGIDHAEYAEGIQRSAGRYAPMQSTLFSSHRLCCAYAWQIPLCTGTEMAALIADVHRAEAPQDRGGKRLFHPPARSATALRPGGEPRAVSPASKKETPFTLDSA